MTRTEIHPYYRGRRPAIIADILDSLRLATTEFDVLLPQCSLSELQPKVLEELDCLLATLPYVGGAAGRMTPFFEQAAGFFALGRVLRSMGVSMDITAALMRKTFLVKLLAISREERHELGQRWLSDENREHLRVLATASNEREYAGDFVYDFIESGTAEDGSKYEFGLNYTECGFCKMCAANGDEELLPVMCSIDKESYALRGIQLFRSTTIAAGDSHCNFRFRALDDSHPGPEKNEALASFAPADEIRARFSNAMSIMYRREVPQYGTLLDLVAEVNAQAHSDSASVESADRPGVDRLVVEGHGAVRVGTPRELSTMRRIFRVMGMQPVGYYDLSVAGVPVHSTAFRPVEQEAININPFRVFTSLLRLELIPDPELRDIAAEILWSRNIFTERALQLLSQHEASGGLSSTEADEFVREVLQTFKLHQTATVSRETYRRLHDANRLIADVVCFKGPHINHLTPRTLDIDAVQAKMPQRGITPKEVIEGPPRRRVPILLRQTSFKALEEVVTFSGSQDVIGTHTARFGEVEQRGIALTRKGRIMYDELLQVARDAEVAGNADYQARLEEAFQAFPDDLHSIRRAGLAFFRYSVTPQGSKLAVGQEAVKLEWLIDGGYVEATPVTYEDFLPVSAAGIFQSNLGGPERKTYLTTDARQEFEEALGANVLDEIDLYEAEQAASIARVSKALGVRVVA